MTHDAKEQANEAAWAFIDVWEETASCKKCQKNQPRMCKQHAVAFDDIGERAIQLRDLAR